MDEEIVVQENAERTLRLIAKIELIVGLVAVIIVFTITLLSMGYLGVLGILIALLYAAIVGLGTLMFWALLNVVANISAKLSLIAAHLEPLDTNSGGPE